MITGFLKDGQVILSEDGYPVIESEKPEAPPYCKAVPSYRLVNDQIIQSWMIVPEITRKEVFEKYLVDQITQLSDDCALQYVILFPEWSSNSIGYKHGDRIRYEMVMYRCLVDHTSQPDYNPKDKTEYWEKVVKS